MYPEKPFKVIVQWGKKVVESNFKIKAINTNELSKICTVGSGDFYNVS